MSCLHRACEAVISEVLLCLPETAGSHQLRYMVNDHLPISTMQAMGISQEAVYKNLLSPPPKRTPSPIPPSLLETSGVSAPSRVALCFNSPRPFPVLNLSPAAYLPSLQPAHPEGPPPTSVPVLIIFSYPPTPRFLRDTLQPVCRFKPPDGLKKSPETNHLADFVSSLEIPVDVEQIIHLKTPEDDLWKVREPFPQQYPLGPHTVRTSVFAYHSGPHCQHTRAAK
ncbi:uncharacterized protein LOC119149890 [Falco rusticolus]|uniref:uncharacterized protein LOC119149890 n=1 Tax=Falco rusticolus TaxID=120794 RepID=UPI0018866D44|nr:uncharacterized protein LOC119149890 [Falco rusticolus]